ncbi:MAG: glycosyltransferase [Spirochaetes bacterium]|nr:MAG: glycosyltransferase [Spirochaetota bacterium]
MSSNENIGASAPTSSAPNRGDAIIVFIKLPGAVPVKTRLGTEIGNDRAAALYRRFVEDEMEILAASGADIIVACDPPGGIPGAELWLGGAFAYAEQGAGDLGERMSAALARAFGMGYGRALLVGSDIPDLPGPMIAQTLSALDSHDAVIGPASDGGYFLVGFNARSFEPRIFADIPWSTETVLAYTTNRLRQYGKSFHLLPAWHDVDSWGDLERLLARISSGNGAAPRTRAWCAENLPDLAGNGA